jgi:DNA polymerase III sliding clamp (beta) subunit (PCNA family)
MMVKSGLSAREFLEQSSCFVFRDGQVMTFNDEVACRKSCEFPVEGAIQAATLLAILEKLTDDKLEVEENEKGELEFHGKKKRFGVTKDSEIFLPIDRVKMPEQWDPLPPGMADAIAQVQHCVSADESRFTLTCIHLHPNWVEACDNFQVMRVRCKTGLEESVLVRGSSLAALAGGVHSEKEDGAATADLGMTHFAMTKPWLHFKNADGLVLSCRRYSEEYPDLDELIKTKGHPIVIPKGLKDASERAAIFATDKSGDPLVFIQLKAGKIRVRGEGLSGWYAEDKSAAYDGPPMEFYIAPDLLYYISEKYDDAQLAPDRLKVSGGGWVYCTFLGMRPAEEKAKG